MLFWSQDSPAIHCLASLATNRRCLGVVLMSRPASHFSDHIMCRAQSRLCSERCVMGYAERVGDGGVEFTCFIAQDGGGLKQTEAVSELHLRVAESLVGMAGALSGPPLEGLDGVHEGIDLDAGDVGFGERDAGGSRRSTVGENVEPLCGGGHGRNSAASWLAQRLKACVSPARSPRVQLSQKAFGFG